MGSRAGAGRRRLVLAVVAAVVAAGAFTVALRFTPQEPELTSAEPRQTPTQSDTAAPSSVTAPTSAAPMENDLRFEEWVDDVAEWLDIPRRAMHAYATATVTAADEHPGCRLSWVTLAGIGRTTTDHGRVNGTELGDDGTPSRPIDTVEIRDFEDAVVSVDGAAGPLQLSPDVWQRWQSGASHSEPDIQNIDDAALTAARALCADGRDTSSGDGWLAAVSALHDEPLFLHRVLATANVYGTVGESRTEPDAAALTAVMFAIDKIGLPYVWGGNGEEKGDAGFDCSGLTTAAYATAGVDLMRTAHTQYHSVPLVPRDAEPALGDLVFFGDPATKIHHVGIYIGNDQMIDAPTFGQAVQVHNYRKPGDNYAGMGRPTGD